MMNDKFKEIKSAGYIEISDKEFKSITDLVYSQLGINLNDSKRALVTGRLQKLLRLNKFTKFEDYYNFLIKDKSGKELSTLADTISTNHTYFWREYDHFELFEKQILPEIINAHKNAGSKSLRLWCAGSSTGEEPYTLVMLMKEVLGNDYKNWDAGILATDISERALKIAKNGIYSKDRLDNLPKRLKKYFKKVNDEEFEISEDVKKEIVYRRFNLMNKKFPFKKPFDIIFCRNVMIYFDLKTRTELANKFYQFTYSGGYLFIGHSETLGRNMVDYKFIKPAVYKKL